MIHLKKYKTKKNLIQAWEHIDEAMSHWYLAMEIISSMKFNDDESSSPLSLKNTIDRIDISALGAVKQHLEELIEEKEKELSTSK